MSKTHQIAEGQDIILFDGVCNLCNNAVNFIIKNDPQNKFKFASLQSDIATTLCKERGIDTSQVDSIIYIKVGEAYYIKSTAALEISKGLKGYSWASIFLWLPESFRNWIYDRIAKNRYNWFGKQDACMLPTPETKARFLDA